MALAVEVFNFSQEAQRITALAPHEHIVPLLELSFDPMEAVFYFVMPIAKDGSLIPIRVLTDNILPEEHASISAQLYPFERE